MSAFFTIIYIKTNRLSDEKIAVGLLANMNGLPEFHYSEVKLNFALKYVNKDLARAMKKSLQLLTSDVNQYVNGESPIPMFDEPYAVKLHKKLTLKKRGILIYGDLEILAKPITFEILFKRYVAKNWAVSPVNKPSKQSFKMRFNQHIANRRFDSFSRKIWLKDDDFPLLTVPVQIDLLRQKNGFTAFKSIDFKLSERTIQQQIAGYRMVIESLASYSEANGLSKGRYYLVYESPKAASKVALVRKIKTKYKSFELIRMSEMVDKI